MADNANDSNNQNNLINLDGLRAFLNGLKTIMYLKTQCNDLFMKKNGEFNQSVSASSFNLYNGANNHVDMKYNATNNTVELSSGGVTLTIPMPNENGTVLTDSNFDTHKWAKAAYLNGHRVVTDPVVNVVWQYEMAGFNSSTPIMNIISALGSAEEGTAALVMDNLLNPTYCCIYLVAAPAGVTAGMKLITVGVPSELSLYYIVNAGDNGKLCRYKESSHSFIDVATTIEPTIINGGNYQPATQGEIEGLFN